MYLLTPRREAAKHNNVVLSAGEPAALLCALWLGARRIGMLLLRASPPSLATRQRSEV